MVPSDAAAAHRWPFCVSVMAADSWGEIIIYNGWRLELPGMMAPLRLHLEGSGGRVDVCDAVQGLASSQTSPQTARGRSH